MAARRGRDGGLGWWGQRWLEYLEREYRLTLSPAEASRARRATVQVSVGSGWVSARVERGSTGNWEKVEVRVKPLTRREWERLVRALAGSPELTRGLFAGSLGPELEERLRAERIELFPPRSRSQVLRCSCRGYWGRACPHLRAMAVHVAALLDANPFLWFEVLGLSRAELFARVRACLADTAPAPARAGRRGGGPAGAAGGAAGLSAERFWETPVDPASIPVRPGRSSAGAALLRALGPLPLPAEAQQVLLEPTGPSGAVDGAWPGSDEEAAPDPELGPGWNPRSFLPLRTHLTEVLRQYAGLISRRAAALAAGEAVAVHRARPLPGQPLPAEEWLALEVAEAVRRSDTVLDLQALHRLCPTAAAAGEDGRVLLRGALERPVADTVVLAGSFAGSRAAVFTGATFRHVVTFDEWYRGDLGPDADWVRALRLAGWEPPYTVHAEDRPWTVLAQEGDGPGPRGLVASLDAGPGDELQFTVTDASLPLLEARLVPRASRNPAELDAAAARAAEVLRQYLSDLWFRKSGRLPEADAVALLLAQGLYHKGAGPDAVWVLPGTGNGVYHVPGTLRRPEERMLTHVDPGWFMWPPSVVCPLHEDDARRRRRLLDGYAARVTRWGRDPRHVQGAVELVGRWCTVWSPPHDERARAPGIVPFLRFLWLDAPRYCRSQRFPAEAALAALTEWFEFLCERSQDLREHYQPHGAACRLVAAFEHRCRTYPSGYPPGHPAMRGWVAEGYRWIGPALLSPA